MMTGPGLALFYGGLVRRKNTLAIMMQSFALMALITVMWALVGYSLCFGGNGPVIGGFEHAFLRGVGAEPNPDYAGTIPQMTFMVYQLMFAIITPALITGATAERMKFSGTVLFLTLWFLVVYAPLAHMVWGKGGLLNASLGGKFPTLDFAGGTVVHISSGVSALVCALYLGKRTGYPKQPMPPHSLVLSLSAPACCGWDGLDQRRQRTGVEFAGHQRLCGDTLCSGRGGAKLECGGVDQERPGQRAGRDFRRGCGTRGDYSSGRIRWPHAGAGNRYYRRGAVLLDGNESEGHLRV